MSESLNNPIEEPIKILQLFLSKLSEIMNILKNEHIEICESIEAAINLLNDESIEYSAEEKLDILHEQASKKGECLAIDRILTMLLEELHDLHPAISIGFKKVGG